MKEQKKKKTQSKGKKFLTWERKCSMCIIPSVIGITVFFGIPYIRMLYYSVINNQFEKKFVGVSNYLDTLKNKYFILALKNSLRLIVIGVPVLITAALLISLLLSFVLKKLAKLRAAFILPMLLPTAGVIILWRSLFAWTDTALPVYALFIWKNIGICIILFTAAFTTIDDSVFEAARLDGAGEFAMHMRMTIPISAPAVVFATLLSIVNTFKIYKESYLYYGVNYPPGHSYTLQYYMNNNFIKFDYQALASAAVLTSVLVFVIVAAGLKWQKKTEV